MSNISGASSKQSDGRFGRTNRQAILESANACFERFGYFETSYADIAANAGLAVKDVTQVFASKDQLLCEFICSYENELSVKLDESKNSLSSQLSQICETCKAALVFLRKHPVITAIWFEFYRHNVAKVVLRQLFGQIRSRVLELVREGIAEGKIKKKDEHDIVEAIMALLEGTLIFSRLEDTTDFEDRFEASWSIMKEGLRA